MPEPTRAKICGLTDPDEAAACAELGVWAIGMVFAEESSRRVDVARARAISDRLPTETQRVGVFVNPTPDEVATAVVGAGLTHAQLHGERVDVAAVAAAAGCAVIQGFSIDGPGALAAARASTADLVLVDAAVAGRHGGTGTTFDWGLLGNEGIGRPYLLAGGLNPHNVRTAVVRYRPAFVDVSSGVESAPGRKDLAKVTAFVEAVRRATLVGSAG